jgi:uncharacterized protein
MRDERSFKGDGALGTRHLLSFFALTFLLSWGVLGLYLGIPGAADLLGPVSNSHPLFILAVYAPAIAAFIVVLWEGGIPGLGRFLSRLLLWRVGAAWWLFVLVGVPLVFFAGAAIAGTLNTWQLPEGLIGAMLFMLVLGPMEEFGWRGFALPLLQRRLAPLLAALIVGAVWGAWHLPAFFLNGTVQSEWSFLPFFLGSLALSIIMTAIFNDARGSILWPMLLHFQLNNPIWPDAQPWDNALITLVALCLVWVRRDAMLSRNAAAAGVIPNRRHHLS